MKCCYLIVSWLIGLNCDLTSLNTVSENLPVKEGGNVVLHCDVGKCCPVRIKDLTVLYQVCRLRDVSGGRTTGLFTSGPSSTS